MNVHLSNNHKDNVPKKAGYWSANNLGMGLTAFDILKNTHFRCICAHMIHINLGPMGTWKIFGKSLLRRCPSFQVNLKSSLPEMYERSRASRCHAANWSGFAICHHLVVLIFHHFKEPLGCASQYGCGFQNSVFISVFISDMQLASHLNGLEPSTWVCLVGDFYIPNEKSTMTWESMKWIFLIFWGSLKQIQDNHIELWTTNQLAAAPLQASLQAQLAGLTMWAQLKPCSVDITTATMGPSEHGPFRLFGKEKGWSRGQCWNDGRFRWKKGRSSQLLK